MPKTANFLSCFGVFEQLNLFRLNFALAVKLYFVVLLIKMVGMLKKFLGGKCARNKKLNITWVEIASQYCTFTLISSLERK